jgi:hypothetical protein
MALHSSDPRLSILRSNSLRPLIIGQNPNRNTAENALSAQRSEWTGGRLARILGMTPEVFEATFDRINILFDHVGPFSVNTLTKNEGMWIKREIIQNARTTILLGSGVARSMSLLVNSKPFPIEEVRSTTLEEVFIVPHPSGMNRQMNDPTVVHRVRELILSLV